MVALSYLGSFAAKHATVASSGGARALAAIMLGEAMEDEKAKVG